MALSKANDLPHFAGVIVSRLNHWPWTPTLAALELFDWRKLWPWALRWLWHRPFDAIGLVMRTGAATSVLMYTFRKSDRMTFGAVVAGSLSIVSLARYQPRAPVILQPAGTEQASAEWLAAFVERSRPELQAVVDEYGAVLLRGFGLAADCKGGSQDSLECSVQAAEQILQAARMQPTDFFGQAPRKQPPGWRFLFRNVAFEAGAPPIGFWSWLRRSLGLVWSRAPQYLTFHNEMAYLNTDKHLGAYGVFFCPMPSLIGGFTPLSDTRRVLTRLKSAMGAGFPIGMKWVLARKKKSPVPKRASGGYLDYLLGIFELEGVPDQFWPTRKVEEIHSFAKSLDLDVMETESEVVVWSRWISPERPLNNGGATWWCNGNHCAVGSADLFARPDALEGLPFLFQFADGTERCATIGEIFQISWALWQEATFFRWKAGDLLLFNNQVVAHNATPGLGPRMVLPSFGKCWVES